MPFESGFTLNAKIDTTDLAKLPRLLRETTQEAANLKRTLGDLMTPQQQRTFENFGEMTRSAISGGTLTPRMKSDIRQSGRDTVQIIREVYSARRAEISNQAKLDESLLKTAHTARMGLLGTKESRRDESADFQRESNIIVRSAAERNRNLITEEQQTLTQIRRLRDEALRDMGGYQQPPRSLGPGETWSSADVGGGGGGGGGGRPSGPGGRFFQGGGVVRGLLGGFARGLGIPLGMGTAGAGYLAGRGLVTQTLSDEELMEGLVRRVGTSGEYMGGTEGLAGFRQRALTIAGPGGLPLFGYAAAARGVERFVSQGGVGGRAGDEFLPAQAAMRAGFGMGIGPEAGADFFGQLARMGQVRQGERGESDVKRISTMIGETIAVTSMRGREPEALSSATTLLAQTLRTMVIPPNIEAVFGLQRRLVEGTPLAERAGVQGELGMRILSTAHEAIAGTELFPGMGPGMSPFLRATMLRAGITDPYEMQEITSGGLFAELPGGQGKLIDALLEEMGPMIRSGGPGKLAAAQAFGFGKAPAFLGRFLSAIEQPETRRFAEEVGFGDVPLERRGLGTEILEKYARGVRGEEGGISAEEATRQMRALGSATATQHETFAQQRAELENVLTKFASDLTPVFTKLTTALSNTVKWAEENYPGGVVGLAGSLLAGRVALGGVGSFLGGGGGGRRGGRRGAIARRGLGGAGRGALGGAVSGGLKGLRGGLYGVAIGAALGAAWELVSAWMEDEGEEAGEEGVSGEAADAAGVSGMASYEDYFQETGGAAGGWGAADFAPTVPDLPAPKEFPPAAVPAISGNRMERFYAAATARGVPASLAHAIAALESSGGANIDPATGKIRMGSKGERGPAQGMPGTFRQYDPTISEAEMDAPRGDEAMARHMERLWRKYGGDEQKVVAAWNAGEGAVDKAIRDMGGGMWWASAYIPEQTKAHLRKYQALPGMTESMGVPGGGGTSMTTPTGAGATGSTWWEEAVRNGIKFSFAPASVTLNYADGEKAGSVELTPHESSQYHGETTSTEAP